MGEILQGVIGTPAPCQLLKTGQNISYNSLEDDGYWEKGVGKLYVPLTGGQYAGTVAIVINAKTHNLSNECVYDKRTRLMWSRYVPNADIGPGNDGKLYWIDLANHEDIFTLKDQANTKQLGGYADWRVPNLLELYTLIKATGASPHIDATAFPSATTGAHYTSTTRPDSTGKALYVSFSGCYAYELTKGTQTAYCRLVRGPK